MELKDATQANILQAATRGWQDGPNLALSGT
jgi:hypothetical protein